MAEVKQNGIVVNPSSGSGDTTLQVKAEVVNRGNRVVSPTLRRLPSRKELEILSGLMLQLLSLRQTVLKLQAVLQSLATQVLKPSTPLA